jgi:hypothetical protein
MDELVRIDGETLERRTPITKQSILIEKDALLRDKADIERRLKEIDDKLALFDKETVK